MVLCVDVLKGTSREVAPASAKPWRNSLARKRPGVRISSAPQCRPLLLIIIVLLMALLGSSFPGPHKGASRVWNASTSNISSHSDASTGWLGSDRTFSPSPRHDLFARIR